MSSCFTIPWSVACQAPASMGFSTQEYWSGLPFPSPGDFPSPGIECTSPILTGRFFTTSATWEAQFDLVQFSSLAQSCPTLCDPMNRSTPGLPLHHQLPESTQTHIHLVSDAIQPSHPLSIILGKFLTCASLKINEVIYVKTI